MVQPKKIKIGDLLVQSNVISQAQLEEALSEQRKNHLKLGRILTDLGFVTEDHLLEILSKQLGFSIIDLKFYDFKPEIVKLLPESYARRYRAIALEQRDNRYVVGMVDPSDLLACDELAKVLNKPIIPALVREADLLRALDLIYRRTDEITSLASELGSSLGVSDFDIAALTITDESEVPVVKLLRSIFEDAVQVKASDIHIEPEENLLRIRQRVDGILQEHVMDEFRIAPALTLRLKLMANLDISEKRLPQDGRLRLKVKGHNIDIRLSTMPVANGESVVMRLLDQTTGVTSIDDLGMPPQLLKEFVFQFKKPNGMILVTGPTGSGKTTTLYAVLKQLNDTTKKIITIEDPVEYRQPRINQIQVNEKIELTFSKVLRSVLRQDPDIIMVGEIRDSVTAQIALRAAITGHLVLSTLHTNDAASSALRLINMGVEGYLVAAALRAIVAQRLLRKICARCRKPYVLTDHDKEWLHRIDSKLIDGQFFYGTGCAHCTDSGYVGRIGVYEMLVPNAAMMSALRRNQPDDFSHALQELKDFKSLSAFALDYAKQGMTTLQEVFRVAEMPEE